VIGFFCLARENETLARLKSKKLVRWRASSEGEVGSSSGAIPSGGIVKLSASNEEGVDDESSARREAKAAKSSRVALAPSLCESRGKGTTGNEAQEDTPRPEGGELPPESWMEP